MDLLHEVLCLDASQLCELHTELEKSAESGGDVSREVFVKTTTRILTRGAPESTSTRRKLRRRTLQQIYKAFDAAGDESVDFEGIVIGFTLLTDGEEDNSRTVDIVFDTYDLDKNGLDYHEVEEYVMHVLTFKNAILPPDLQKSRDELEDQCDGDVETVMRQILGVGGSGNVTREQFLAWFAACKAGARPHPPAPTVSPLEKLSGAPLVTSVGAADAPALPEWALGALSGATTQQSDPALEDAIVESLPPAPSIVNGRGRGGSRRGSGERGGGGTGRGGGRGVDRGNRVEGETIVETGASTEPPPLAEPLLKTEARIITALVESALVQPPPPPPGATAPPVRMSMIKVRAREVANAMKVAHAVNLQILALPPPTPMLDPRSEGAQSGSEAESEEDPPSGLSLARTARIAGHVRRTVNRLKVKRKIAADAEKSKTSPVSWIQAYSLTQQRVYTVLG